MGFQTLKYETDGGDIAQIRVDDDLVASVGTEPAGATTTPFFVKISKTNREFGIRPRFATYSLEETTTSGRAFKVYKRVPKLTQTDLDNAPATLTYNGDTYDLATKTNEDY